MLAVRALMARVFRLSTKGGRAYNPPPRSAGQGKAAFRDLSPDVRRILSDASSQTDICGCCCRYRRRLSTRAPVCPASRTDSASAIQRHLARPVPGQSSWPGGVGRTPDGVRPAAARTGARSVLLRQLVGVLVHSSRRFTGWDERAALQAGSALQAVVDVRSAASSQVDVVCEKPHSAPFRGAAGGGKYARQPAGSRAPMRV